MKRFPYLLLTLTGLLPFSCNNKEEPTPVPNPCEDIAILTKPIDATWLTPDVYFNQDFKPIITANEVIFSELPFSGPERLVGLDKETGELKWEAKTPCLLSGNNTQYVQNKVYFVNQLTNQFSAFDPLSQTFSVLWDSDTTNAILSPFFLVDESHVYLTLAYPVIQGALYNLALVDVDLATGLSTELYRYNMRFTYFDYIGFNDFRLSKTSSGAQMLAFIQTEYQDAAGVVSKLISINLQSKQLLKSIQLPKYYLRGSDQLLVDQQTAWVLITDADVSGYNLETGATLWKVDANDCKNILQTKDRIILVGNATVRAYLSNTGTGIWEQKSTLSPVYLSTRTTILDHLGSIYIIRNESIAKINVETGCFLAAQPITQLPKGKAIYGLEADSSLKSLYFALDKQMFKIRLDL